MSILWLDPREQKMIVVSYTTKGKPTPENIKVCEEGAKAMCGLLYETAKLHNKYTAWIVWLMAKFYRKKISDNEIAFEFYLFPSISEKPFNRVEE